MQDIQLVIFDCDGVLVDSEVIANRVFATLLQQSCGLHFSQEEMFSRFVGRSASQCRQIVTDLLGHPPPDDLQERYETEINQALASEVEAIAGIEDVLQNLQQPCCVASGGSHAKMHTTLGKTGLLKYFQGRLFSTTEVSRGKPYPDIFIYAADKMQTCPHHCLVIEDSPSGVQAAVAAGMWVCGYAERMSAEQLLDAGAHQVIYSMDELLPLLKQA